MTENTTPMRPPLWRRLLSPAVLPLISAVLLFITRLLKGVLFQGETLYVTVVALQIIIFLLPVGVFVRLRGDGYLSRLRLRPGRPESVLLMLSTALLLITGGVLLSMLFSGINNLAGTFTLYDTFRTGEGGGFSGPTVYLILAYAALPAISEEILFRGVLLAEYQRHGVGLAVAVSSVLFAAVHFNLGGLPVYLFSGAVLAITTFLSRSVWNAVIAHFLYNLFGLFGQPYLRSFYEITGSTSLFLFLLVALLLLSLAVFCGETARLCRLYASRNVKHLEPPKARDGQTVPLRVRMKAVFLKPDAIACYAIWLVASILFIFLK